MADTLIAIVDDDLDVVNTISGRLEREGFRTKGIPDAERLFEFLNKGKPDLILLDLMLPGMDGFEACGKIKADERYSSIPIIILSGKKEVPDKISGLDMGADDYMVKPFSMDELIARIRVILRRQPQEGREAKITVGSTVAMDLKRHEVLVDGVKVELTPAEFKILEFLASRKGQVFSRERILDYMWGEEKIVIERTIDVHIKHLRGKLGKAGALIKNIRGIGYKLEED
jgi:two-component system phosphate regulon response regulator PhoB/two-component system alkaline phosphatase synthesis response regulator PhoP